MIDRLKKRKIFAKRGGRCELCGAPATDLHHIANKYRYASIAQDERLLSALCNSCNLGADTRLVRAHLLLLNVARYGESEMREAIEGLRASSKAVVDFDIPNLSQEQVGILKNPRDYTLTDAEFLIRDGLIDQSMRITETGELYLEVKCKLFYICQMEH